MNAERNLLDWISTAISREQLLALLQECLGWGLAGAALGLLLGFVSYRLFRRWRWYGATSTAGRWTQRLLGGLALMVSVLLLGLAGVGEGLHRQIRPALTNGQLGTLPLSRLADEIADGVVAIDLALQQQGRVQPAELNARLADFRQGRRELPAEEFLQRLDQAQIELKQEFLAALETKIRQAHPRLPAWATHLLRTGFDELGSVLLERKVTSEMQTRGLAPIYRAIREGMVAEAARRGDPRTISRQELSTLLWQQGIVPAIATPVETFLRQQQGLLLFATTLVCFLPALLCRLFRPASASTRNS